MEISNILKRIFRRRL